MRLTGEARFTDVFDIEVVGDRTRALDIIINMRNYPKLEKRRHLIPNTADQEMVDEINEQMDQLPVADTST
ncbi:hypothetical protein Aduo_005505 [Ancylostoma duodenale]